MKKMNNKKGFTLAELLIVIAIIAILIAIAIPAFSGALDNARLQTDHANMRSAYAIAQTAEMLGTIDVKNGTAIETQDAAGSYWFNKDGTVSKKKDDAYTLATTVKSGEESKCDASIVCKSNSSHAIDNGIKITVTVDATTKKRTATVVTIEKPTTDLS